MLLKEKKTQNKKKNPPKLPKDILTENNLNPEKIYRLYLQSSSW